MPNRLTFLSDLSAIPQTPCPSAFRLKDMHREMFQPENILQENQIPKNRRNIGPAEGFQSPAEGLGVCGKNEGFFKVFYTEYYERPYLTEKSKISS